MTTQHQAAGGVAVESMGKRRRARQAKAQRIKSVLQTRAAFGAAMYGDAGGFIDYQHQPVAMQ